MSNDYSLQGREIRRVRRKQSRAESGGFAAEQSA